MPSLCSSLALGFAFSSAALPPKARISVCPPTQCSRHFSRPSLQATGLYQPEDILQHCLTLFRKADAAALRPFLGPLPTVLASTADLAVSSQVGGVQVQEEGPLACLGTVLDVGARRVLPGHLLRRSRVLSTLRLGPGSFQQRTALTACTGEEAVLVWHLRQRTATAAEEGATASGDSEQHDSGLMEAPHGQWYVVDVHRDPESDVPLPTTPHPKASPEAVVKAQLQALAAGDIFEAASFNMWRHLDAQRPRTGGKRRFDLGLHFEKLQGVLAKPPYSTLLYHSGAMLGPAALLSQRSMLQEVSVRGHGDAQEERFLWKLGMQANGCWVTTAITPVLSAHP